MKVWVINNDREMSEEIADRLKSQLQEAKIDFDEKNPDLVITVGGDGTFLGAFQKYSDQLDKVRFTAVHTGHLGFYADWRDYEISDLVDAIVNQSDNGKSNKFPVLDLTIEYSNGKQDKLLAINEATIRRPTKTMRADVFIDDKFFERFRGDGLCVCTPTGSTAYSKSIGGAVIHPDISVLQLTEMASINNRVYRSISSPIIIPAHEELEIVPSAQNDYIVNSDVVSREHTSVKRIICKVSDQTCNFARYRSRHFWDRVEGSFIGLNEKTNY